MIGVLPWFCPSGSPGGFKHQSTRSPVFQEPGCGLSSYSPRLCCSSWNLEALNSEPQEGLSHPGPSKGCEGAPSPLWWLQEPLPARLNFQPWLFDPLSSCLRWVCGETEVPDRLSHQVPGPGEFRPPPPPTEPLPSSRPMALPA